jgi:Cro/C1-type HTH DNA-binding domain
MPVKHRLPDVLNQKCRHFFEARWPDEFPLQINAYKLKVLTRLSQGTCLKLISDEFYVPNEKVMDRLCEVFDLQPGDFLYHEPSANQSREFLFARHV